jgi:hypothetical protein
VIRIAQARDGSFAAAWGSDPGNIYLRRFAANGRPLGPPAIVGRQDFIGGGIQLGSAPDGRTAVSWGEIAYSPSSGETGTIRIRFFAPNGTPASGPLSVDEPPHPVGWLASYSLALDRSGRALLVWSQIDLDQTERDKVQLWTPGGAVSPVLTLAPDPFSTEGSFCASTAAAGRTWVVVWRAPNAAGEDTIYFRRFFS